jgi:hypothetical protein
MKPALAEMCGKENSGSENNPVSFADQLTPHPKERFRPFANNSEKGILKLLPEHDPSDPVLHDRLSIGLYANASNDENGNIKRSIPNWMRMSP